MTKFYAIHPGIGLARVGNHPESIFVAPETRIGAPRDIDAAGVETPLTHYRLEGRLKRQAARFRVFEYEVTDGQVVGAPREVLDRQVEWTVRLANRKAASRILEYAGQPAWDSDTAPFRNADIADPTEREARLVIAPELPPIAGALQRWAVPPRARFLDETDVYLGELRTDAQGRLLVLGGHGRFAGPGQPGHFADNDRWRDDVADGPVEAVIIEADGVTRTPVDLGAWVVVAPPDFAPGVPGILTMYERAYESAVAKGIFEESARPSYRDHIAPLLRRAAALRWTTKLGAAATRWTESELRDLGAPGVDQAAKDKRTAARRRLRSVIDRIEQFKQVPSIFVTTLPGRPSYLDRWIAGDFDSDYGVPINVDNPREIDRASLEQFVGGGFFPGIEGGIRMTYPQIWSDTHPFRLKPAGSVYEHVIVAEANEALHRTLVPGHLTERMAVPWQADFLACRIETTALWWPSQRPDFYAIDPTAGQADPSQKWYAGSATHWFDAQAETWMNGRFIKPVDPEQGIHLADASD